MATDGIEKVATAAEEEFMRLAIDEARKCQAEDERIHPRVGAVLVLDGKVLASAYRGELAPGDHAEFTLLERKLRDVDVAGATAYVTLEPCTARSPGKIPCAERLIERRIARVVVGMLDPDPRILGQGNQRLRSANVEFELFPSDLAAKVEDLNREFIRHRRGAIVPAPWTLRPYFLAMVVGMLVFAGFKFAPLLFEGERYSVFAHPADGLSYRRGVLLELRMDRGQLAPWRIAIPNSEKDRLKNFSASIPGGSPTAGFQTGIITETVDTHAGRLYVVGADDPLDERRSAYLWFSIPPTEMFAGSDDELRRLALPTLTPPRHSPLTIEEQVKRVRNRVDYLATTNEFGSSKRMTLKLIAGPYGDDRIVDADLIDWGEVIATLESSGEIKVGEGRGLSLEIELVR